MNHVTATDEHGKVWIVYEGDPGWPPCLSLLRAGVREVVLPRATYMTGFSPPLEAVAPIRTSIEVIERFPEVKAVVRRMLRLRDCVAFLHEQGTDC